MDRQKYLDEYGNQVDPLFDMVDNLEAEVERLREGLQDLVDLQNGPPLVRYEKEWQQAYDNAVNLLKGGE